MCLDSPRGTVKSGAQGPLKAETLLLLLSLSLCCFPCKVADTLSLSLHGGSPKAETVALLPCIILPGRCTCSPVCELGDEFTPPLLVHVFFYCPELRSIFYWLFENKLQKNLPGLVSVVF